MKWKGALMQPRAESLRLFSEAIAERQWDACPALLYRTIYGLPSSVLLPMAAEQIARIVPIFEKRWPNVTWPRAIVVNTKEWIERFGRSIPDSPERDSVADARFVFSLDALLLAASYPQDVSVLTSSCASAIREVVGIRVQLSAAEGDLDDNFIEECEGCGAGSKQRLPPDVESPVEFARSREWQTVLDACLARNLQSYPSSDSPEQLEADLAAWQDHEMLLIVPAEPVAMER
jgi:hypothetical protein